MYDCNEYSKGQTATFSKREVVIRHDHVSCMHGGLLHVMESQPIKPNQDGTYLQCGSFQAVTKCEKSSLR